MTCLHNDTVSHLGLTCPLWANAVDILLYVGAFRVCKFPFTFFLYILSVAELYKVFWLALIAFLLLCVEYIFYIIGNGFDSDDHPAFLNFRRFKMVHDKELLFALYNFFKAQQAVSESINQVLAYLPHPQSYSSLNIDSKPMWPSEDWNE